MLSRGEAAFIARQRVAHLATADADGRPHVVPVCFAYEGGCFYIAIDEKPKRTTRLKRLRNISENPAVSLIFDHYEEDWGRLAYVLVQGSATVLEHEPEHERAVAALRRKYAQYASMALGDRPVIKVRPERAASWGRLAAST